MGKSTASSWLRPTTRVERALQDAQEYARRDGHDLMQSGHLLLALVQEPRSFSTLMLAHLGVSAQELSAAIAQAEARGRGASPPERHDRLEDRARLQPAQDAWASRRSQMLNAGRQEAQELGDTYLGTEHLLLALIRWQDASGEALHSLGITPERALSALAELREAVPV